MLEIVGNRVLSNYLGEVHFAEYVKQRIPGLLGELEPSVTQLHKVLVEYIEARNKHSTEKAAEEKRQREEKRKADKEAYTIRREQRIRNANPEREVHADKAETPFSMNQYSLRIGVQEKTISINGNRIAHEHLKSVEVLPCARMSEWAGKAARLRVKTLVPLPMKVSGLMGLLEENNFDVEIKEDDWVTVGPRWDALSECCFPGHLVCPQCGKPHISVSGLSTGSKIGLNTSNDIRLKCHSCGKKYTYDFQVGRFAPN